MTTKPTLEHFMETLPIGTIVGVRKSDSLNAYRRFWKIVKVYLSDPLNINSPPHYYDAIRCSVTGKEFTRGTSLNVDYFQPNPNRSFVIEVIGQCTHRDKVHGNPRIGSLKRRIKFLNRRIVSDTLLLNDNVRQLSILEKESLDG